MAAKSLLESLTPTGHLEIIKRYLDGREEVVLSDHNMVTVGMGVDFAVLFGDASQTFPSIKRFQFGYFQVGKGNGSSAASSITALINPFTYNDYQGGNLAISTHNRVSTGGATTLQSFVAMDPSMVTRPSKDQVQYTIDLDANTANGASITEVGLFATDPFGQSEEFGGGTGGIYGSLLCAYRYFTAIAKTSTFSITFKWTLKF